VPAWDKKQQRERERGEQTGEKGKSEERKS
jgi:hypothetical protein